MFVSTLGGERSTGADLTHEFRVHDARPTYPFAHGHTVLKMRVLKEHHKKLEHGSLRVLLATSCIMLVQGIVLLAIADMWGDEVRVHAKRALRNWNLSIGVAATAQQKHDYLQTEYSISVFRLGYASIATGFSSMLNYARYTGRMNLYSIIDFFCASCGCLLMFWETVKWIVRGNLAMTFNLAWSTATVLLYVFRQDPNEQALVHLSGILGVLCWTILASTHIHGYAPIFVS